MVQTVRHYFPELPKWLGEMPDTRCEPFIIYAKEFLWWWGLLLFLLKLGSRRQLDFDLRDDETEVLGNVNRLAGTKQETSPVNGTLDHFVGHVGAPPFADVRRKMIHRLIRMKALDRCRLRGRFVLVADATGHLCFSERHCEHCLKQKHGDKTIYMHQVLEVKLVSPFGLALSVGTEFIENPSELPDDTAASKEQRKQDCELKALSRLAPVLKRDFPQTPICLAGDNLFACGRAIQIAEDNAWSYVYTFKRGGMPAVWDNFQALLRIAPENILRITTPDGVKRLYRWASGITYEDDQKRTHKFNAIQCEETRDGKTRLFAWITNIRVSAKSVDAIATQGGRDRWKIENQGFNTPEEQRPEPRARLQHRPREHQGLLLPPPDRPRHPPAPRDGKPLAAPRPPARQDRRGALRQPQAHRAPPPGMLPLLPPPRRSLCRWHRHTHTPRQLLTPLCCRLLGCFPRCSPSNPICLLLELTFEAAFLSPSPRPDPPPQPALHYSAAYSSELGKPSHQVGGQRPALVRGGLRP